MVLCTLKYIKRIEYLVFSPKKNPPKQTPKSTQTHKRTQGNKYMELIHIFSTLIVVRVLQCMHLSKLIKICTVNMCNFLYIIDFIIPVFKTGTT